MPKCLPDASQDFQSLTLLIPRDVSVPSHLCSQGVLASTAGSKRAPYPLTPLRAGVGCDPLHLLMVTGEP